MGLFLFRFWPVLVPLVLYVLWWNLVRRKAEKEGRPKPHFREGPWYWAVLASLLTGVACFLYLGATTEGEKGEYIPPHMENGTVVPGQVNR